MRIIVLLIAIVDGLSEFYRVMRSTFLYMHAREWTCRIILYCKMLWNFELVLARTKLHSGM